MPNPFALNGAQPQKPSRFSTLYSGRFYSGIWTNRSPLRDANTTRLQEKFYGAAGDALIAGNNVEITNRLTLARRPGSSVFDSNTWTNVLRFDEFHLFDPLREEIKIMVDQTDGLYALFQGQQKLIWSKSPNAGQTNMQSVGNSLYFGNGVDNKKWLQSLVTWQPNQRWNTPTTPFLSTFLIDENGNIQQLTAAQIPILIVEVVSGVLTVNTGQDMTNILDIGQQLKFADSGFTATFLEGKTVTITSVSGPLFTAALAVADYPSTADTGTAQVVQGGNPISGATEPVWSTVPLTPGMADPSLAITVDNTVVWTNRGNPVENWGIVAPTNGPVPSITGADKGWQSNTYYMIDGLIIDSNGGLQQVSTSGVSSASVPAWPAANAGVGSFTNDGTVVWKKIQTAASLVWQSHFAYDPTTSPPPYVIGTARDGVQCLFRASRGPGLTLTGNPTIKYWNGSTMQSGGIFTGTFPAPAADATVSNNNLSLQFNPTTSAAPTTSPAINAVINKNGEVANITTPYSGATENYALSVYGTFRVPKAGMTAISVGHDDGFFFGIDGGATCTSGPNTGTGALSNTTPVNGYPILGGNNVAGDNFETYGINFPSAGTYNFEFCFAQGGGPAQTLGITNGDANFVKEPFISTSTEPHWPSWTISLAPQRPNIFDASTNKAINFVDTSSICLLWTNLGPISDMQWRANTRFHLAGGIIDANGNSELPFRAGISGTTAPVWKTGLNQLTQDNSFDNLLWINRGPVGAPPPNTLSTFNGGWKYTIALVNTLDDTVSNCSPLSAATGNFIGIDSITIPPGSGLEIAKIDPQVDYVAIFRTTDGQATPFLIPGTGNSIYTVSLADYLANGYTDKTQDTGLNNLIQGAISGENTPPLPGAQNLAYHLNRIFFSVGNTVYWTSGPDTPVGNGLNGVAPLNFDGLPSLIKRIVPVAIGVLVFTVEGIFIIQGQGTPNSPIQGAQPFLDGLGLLNYNALDVNGSIIGFFTTDQQFVVLDPNSGVSYDGFPIGDQFRLNNGQPGTSWDATKVYVTWYSNGEDQGWYVSDGQFGWFRLMRTPAPESGLTWSPFATIVGGCRAVECIEVSPGVHRLLIGPFTSGQILQRDLGTYADNGQSYSAFGVIGSLVLAHPGQVALVTHITTDSVHVGTPLTLGVLIDEALPYFEGPFEPLTVWESDPPGLKQSRSILGQRFYLAELTDEAAAMRHLQIRINFLPENKPNELLSLSVFGTYMQEA